MMMQVEFRGHTTGLAASGSVVKEYMRLWRVIGLLNKPVYDGVMSGDIAHARVSQVLGQIAALLGDTFPKRQAAHQELGKPYGTTTKTLSTWEWEARQVGECSALLKLLQEVKDIDHFRTGEYKDRLKMEHRLLGMFLNKEIDTFLKVKPSDVTVPMLRQWIAGRLMAFALTDNFVIEFDFGTLTPVFRGDPIQFAYFELSNLFRSTTSKLCKRCGTPFEGRRGNAKYCGKGCQTVANSTRWNTLNRGKKV